MMEMGMFACSFPGCGAKVSPAHAQVPAMAAIRQAEGRSCITSSDVARHAHCRLHAGIARRNGLKMYSYLGTIQELERRVREREAAKTHFGRYAAPKPETAMGVALRKAGMR